MTIYTYYAIYDYRAIDTTNSITTKETIEILIKDIKDMTKAKIEIIPFILDKTCGCWVR